MSVSQAAIDAAQRVLINTGIVLATSHVTSPPAGDTAQDNVADTANGEEATRTEPGVCTAGTTAPGGTVPLQASMLEGMEELTRTYTMRVSEVCGGCHGATSRHFAGVAFDVDRIDGKAVAASHPTYKAFMTDAKAAGATEVLGPGDPGHDTHVHAAWARP